MQHSTYPIPPRTTVSYLIARDGASLASVAQRLSETLRRDAERLPEREWVQLAGLLDRLDLAALGLLVWSRQRELEHMA